MTFIIPNETHPENKPKKLEFGFDYTTGIRENNQIVNFADWVSDIVSPASGIALNVNVSEIAELNSPVSLDGLSNSKFESLFYSDFTSGLDTLNKFNVVYHDTAGGGNYLQLASQKDAEAISGANRLGQSGETVNKSQSRLPITITDTDGTGSVFVIESKNTIKIPSTGTTFVKMQGTYQDNSFDPQPVTMGFGVANVNPIGAVPFVVDQQNWNIDTFDGSGQSGITINDWQLCQEPMIMFNEKYSGDIIFGFKIKNNFYPAHRVQVNNYYSNPVYGNSNVVFRDEVFRDQTAKTITRKVGLFDGNHGVFFQSVTDISSGSPRNLFQDSKSYSVITTGSINNDDIEPFRAYAQKLVNSSNMPIISFQALDPMYGQSITNTLLTIANRTNFFLRQLQVNTASANVPDSVIIKIILNANLEKAGATPVIPTDYIEVAPGSGVGYETVSETVTGGIEIWTGIVDANNSIDFDLETIKNKISSIKYMKFYDDLGAADYSAFYNNICIVASPRSPTTEIDTAIVVKGFENQ